MKYAMLKQQPLLRVQVAAAALKKNNIFLKKEIQALTLWKNKHMDKGGKKCYV